MPLVYFIRIFFDRMFYIQWFCTLLDLLNAKSFQFNSIQFNSVVTRLSGNAGISVCWIMWVMTNQCSMSDLFSLLIITLVHLEVINPVLWFPGLSAVAIAGDIPWYVGVLPCIVACVGAHKWKDSGTEGEGEWFLCLMLPSLSKVM
jgi:hypothetical protein